MYSLLSSFHVNLEGVVGLCKSKVQAKEKELQELWCCHPQRP